MQYSHSIHKPYRQNIWTNYKVNIISYNSRSGVILVYMSFSSRYADFIYDIPTFHVIPACPKKNFRTSPIAYV